MRDRLHLNSAGQSRTDGLGWVGLGWVGEHNGLERFFMLASAACETGWGQGAGGIHNAIAKRSHFEICSIECYGKMKATHRIYIICMIARFHMSI